MLSWSHCSEGLYTAQPGCCPAVAAATSSSNALANAGFVPGPASGEVVAGWRPGVLLPSVTRNPQQYSARFRVQFEGNGWGGGLPYATWLPYPMSKSPDDPWTGISGPVFLPTVEGGQLILDFLVGPRRRPLAAYLNGYASG